MAHSRASTVGLGFLAVLLAPILYVALWSEVVYGGNGVWSNLQTGQRSMGWAFVDPALLLVGPLAVVIVTLMSRKKNSEVLPRIVQIELWGILISFPIAVFVLFMTVSIF